MGLDCCGLAVAVLGFQGEGVIGIGVLCGRLGEGVTLVLGFRLNNLAVLPSFML